MGLEHSTRRLVFHHQHYCSASYGKGEEKQGEEREEEKEEEEQEEEQQRERERDSGIPHRHFKLKLSNSSSSFSSTSSITLPSTPGVQTPSDSNSSNSSEGDSSDDVVYDSQATTTTLRRFESQNRDNPNPNSNPNPNGDSNFVPTKFATMNGLVVALTTNDEPSTTELVSTSHGDVCLWSVPENDPNEQTKELQDDIMMNNTDNANNSNGFMNSMDSADGDSEDSSSNGGSNASIDSNDSNGSNGCYNDRREFITAIRNNGGGENQENRETTTNELSLVLHQQLELDHRFEQPRVGVAQHIREDRREDRRVLLPEARTKKRSESESLVEKKKKKKEKKEKVEDNSRSITLTSFEEKSQLSDTESERDAVGAEQEQGGVNQLLGVLLGRDGQEQEQEQVQEQVSHKERREEREFGSDIQPGWDLSRRPGQSQRQSQPRSSSEIEISGHNCKAREEVEEEEEQEHTKNKNESHKGGAIAAAVTFSETETERETETTNPEGINEMGRLERLLGSVGVFGTRKQKSTASTRTSASTSTSTSTSASTKDDVAVGLNRNEDEDESSMVSSHGPRLDTNKVVVEIESEAKVEGEQDEAGVNHQFDHNVTVQDGAEERKEHMKSMQGDCSCSISNNQDNVVAEMTTATISRNTSSNQSIMSMPMSMSIEGLSEKNYNKSHSGATSLGSSCTLDSMVDSRSTEPKQEHKQQQEREEEREEEPGKRNDHVKRLSTECGYSSSSISTHSGSDNHNCGHSLQAQSGDSESDEFGRSIPLEDTNRVEEADNESPSLNLTTMFADGLQMLHNSTQRFLPSPTPSSSSSSSFSSSSAGGNPSSRSHIDGIGKEQSLINSTYTCATDDDKTANNNHSPSKSRLQRLQSQPNALPPALEQPRVQQQRWNLQQVTPRQLSHFSSSASLPTTSSATSSANKSDKLEVVQQNHAQDNKPSSSSTMDTMMTNDRGDPFSGQQKTAPNTVIPSTTQEEETQIHRTNFSEEKSAEPTGLSGYKSEQRNSANENPSAKAEAEAQVGAQAASASPVGPDYGVNHEDQPSQGQEQEQEHEPEQEQRQLLGQVSCDDFIPVKLLGSGSHGKVFLVKHRESNAWVALKVLEKAIVHKKGQCENTMNEFRIHSYLAEKRYPCPYIVPMRYAFQTSTHLYFGFEFLSGGELYYHLGVRGEMDEYVAKIYAAEICLALGYLHASGILYHDLKPENLCLDDEGHVCLVDFGLAIDQVHAWNSGSRSFCGTAEYLAPEILKHHSHGLASDWWSFGMVLYEMLVGYPPWYSDNQDIAVNGILHDSLEFPRFISDDACDLIERLLHKDPRCRLGNDGGACEIMAHPFFANVDWCNLARKRVPPPFSPPNTSANIVENFDTEFTNTPIEMHLFRSQSAVVSTHSPSTLPVRPSAPALGAPTNYKHDADAADVPDAPDDVVDGDEKNGIDEREEIKLPWGNVFDSFFFDWEAAGVARFWRKRKKRRARRQQARLQLTGFTQV